MLTGKVGRITPTLTRSITPLDLSPEPIFLPDSSPKTRDPPSNAFDRILVQPSLIQRAGQSHGHHHPRRRISLRYFSTSGPSPVYGTRAYSTKTTEKPAKDQSLFSSHGTPWDQVFHDIDNLPLLPSQILPTRPHAPSKHNPNHSNPRRQSMTAREVHAFDQMFNMIFDAVDAQQSSSSSPSTSSDPSLFHSSTGSEDGPFAPIEGASIGLSKTSPGQGLSSLYAHLRRQSGKSKTKWNNSSYLDAELDKKKEEIELCESDARLLEWAMREVFGESVRYEEDARKALDSIASPNPNVDGADTHTQPQPQPKRALPILQPPTYPYLLAHLMRTFRTKYASPHLSLALFHHARHLSIPSYVFGCTTPAYNELLDTLWGSFGDVRGVLGALEEMRSNGVMCNQATRGLVERVRREVGGRVVWGEEGGAGAGTEGVGEWGGGGLEEVMGMVGRIEELVMAGQGRGARKGREEGRSGRGAGMRRDEWKRGGREVAAVAA